jgi:hypothetical protein
VLGQGDVPVEAGKAKEDDVKPVVSALDGDGWPVEVPAGDWQFLREGGRAWHIGDLDGSTWTGVEALCGYGEGWRAVERRGSLLGFTGPVTLCGRCARLAAADDPVQANDAG